MRTNNRDDSDGTNFGGRILVLALCVCAIAMNRSADIQQVAAQSDGPMQCDSGMSRHSLHAAVMVAREDIAAPEKSGNAEDAPPGMVWVRGGRFWMGTNHMEDAQPVHQVEVKGFWIDRTDVTNEEFARFVQATGYVTVAERPLDPKEFPDLAPADLAPGGVVFTPPAGPVALENPLAWWRFVRGANWRHPNGPKSNLQGKEKFPVVQIAWADAVAYAKWAGKRLPTEAEWEFASRGGRDRQNYAWGNELNPNGKWMANTFQGHFPDKNTSEDGLPPSPGRIVPPQRFRPVRHVGKCLAVGGGLVSPRLLLAASGQRFDRNRPSRALRQFRSAGARRRQACAKRRFVSLHRSVLRALHCRCARERRSRHRNQPLGFPLRPRPVNPIAEWRTGSSLILCFSKGVSGCSVSVNWS